MIVRDEGETLLLITQPNHAWLAEQIVASVRTERALESADRNTILLATREHDNGWAEVDAEPTVDAATGRPCDFMSGSAIIKHELWLRGIARVAKVDRHAGALVAEHALTVHGYRRGDSEWQSFFESITALRDDLLQQIGMLTGAPRATFHAQYRCVQLADAFSLQFCNGWSEQQSTLEYRAAMHGDTLLISPDPFGGITVPLRVLGRRIPWRPYRDDGDLRHAVAAITPFVVEGKARGSDSIVVAPH
ncbi:MAG TPA: DUF3891 family protein [Vicinamibacterales bacterium]